MCNDMVMERLALLQVWEGSRQRSRLRLTGSKSGQKLPACGLKVLRQGCRESEGWRALVNSPREIREGLWGDDVGAELRK